MRGADAVRYARQVLCEACGGRGSVGHMAAGHRPCDRCGASGVQPGAAAGLLIIRLVRHVQASEGRARLGFADGVGSRVVTDEEG